jgi:hypothetical protein
MLNLTIFVVLSSPRFLRQGFCLPLTGVIFIFSRLGINYFLPNSYDLRLTQKIFIQGLVIFKENACIKDSDLISRMFRVRKKKTLFIYILRFDIQISNQNFNLIYFLKKLMHVKFMIFQIHSH